MASKKTLIANYLKHRFFERFDTAGNNLSVLALQKLKDNLSETEFEPYKNFDTATTALVDLISEDEGRTGTPADKKIITDYEKLADEKSLPRNVRAEMYNLVLIGREKFIDDDNAFLNTISKRLPLLNKNNISDLRYTAMLIKQHSPKGTYHLKHKLLSDIRSKLSDDDYPDKQEGAALKKMSAEEKKRHRNSLACQKVANIDQQLKESLSPDERAELLLQKIEVLGHCGLGRIKTCRAKLSIYQELEYLSIVNNDMEAADFYARKQEHQIQVENNIFKYSRLRAKGRNF